MITVFDSRKMTRNNIFLPCIYTPNFKNYDFENYFEEKFYLPRLPIRSKNSSGKISIIPSPLI